MDVSNLLAAEAAKFASVNVEKDVPLEVDAGLLTVTDLNPIDEEAYNDNLEEHLQSLARDGVQSLFQSLFSLPTQSSPDGPIAQLPQPVTQLPRAKPLPKPKAPTKWELFAAAKGIQHRRTDKKVWDEERQDWVNRWGRDGKNRQVEDQWIHEVPLNAPVDFDPRKAARDERKERISKNEKQRLQNVAREQGASARDQRKQELDTTLATSRVSTASMGKFDKKLDGEKKMRGMKRKFVPNEMGGEEEKQASLALLSRMESDGKKMRREPPSGDEGVLNTRKAVRFASKGRGGVALGRDKAGAKGKGRDSKDRGKGKPKGKR
ncbi:ribosome biogenesis regulatory protein-domain-containing protein [Schizophyllum amplum]|uniref:Ribosome biogenesis regulatory protein n=1 Tax=Schizophyllum amplum TaxID=97359 RepID=A0A550C382_9AGAR|nr:ribosome biogenesis regulatory protein-domain-containing protein [Auriculariopsis ampla]